jgi:phage FluMu gp28-like protein
MIAELAAQEWPGYVSQVMISLKWYAENFPKLKERMEDGTTTIPDDIFIRDDFRVVGLKAGVPVVLERSGGVREKRHGDGAIAKLMAVFAMLEDEDKGYQPMTYETVETDNRYRAGRSDIWDE